MNALKKILKNRFLGLALLVCAAMSATGCDELNSLRGLLSLTTPGIQSPLAPLLGDFGDLGGYDDFGGGDGWDDFGGFDDFDF